jgi:hypothetical protein
VSQLGRILDKSERFSARPFAMAVQATADAGGMDAALPKLTSLASDSLVTLLGSHVYSCANCRVHLCHYEDVISKNFVSGSGRAFLISHGVNVTFGAREQRHLLTGLHVVCDVQCARCDKVVGWKYIEAHNASEKYKEGKMVFEKHLMVAEWDEGHGGIAM